MDVDVIDLEFRACKKKIACVLVRYCELFMRCDLVYHVKTDKAWVRMPEVWISNEKKLHYCYWPTKEKSDEFQNVILNKIFDKYSLDLGKIKDLHRQAIESRGNSKNARQDLKK